MNSSSGFYAVPRLKPFNESKHCFECSAVFNLFKQKYHCRNCGNVICSNCSSHKYPLLKFGYENPVRCCNTCDKFIKMQTMSSSDLSNLTPKMLKEYINAYQLPAKSAIEKSDLVKIIFNTRPISNDDECHYRLYRNHNNKPLVSNNNTQGANRRNNEQQQRQEPNRRNNEQQQRQEPNRRYNNEQQQRQEPRQQQQQQQYTSNTQRPLLSKSTPTSNSDTLSLNDLVKGNIDPSILSVRTLKSILKANFVEQSHVIEKAELVRLVKRLIDQQKKDTAKETSDDSLCRICCDAQQNCVFLNCGHMVTCMDCAKQLIQTKNECPICREPILKLVHVFRS